MNKESIKNALVEGIKKGGLDLLFHEGLDSDKWEEIRNESNYAHLVKKVEEKAESYRNKPITCIPFRKYKLFDTTGSRIEYETAYFERRGRLNTYAVMILLHQDKESIENLEDVIWSICDEYTWCLPAHLGGDSLKSTKNHKEVVDLFSAETGFALSEILALVGEQLSPLVVHRAKSLVLERIIEPYYSNTTPFFWETCSNNWASVCAGSVGAAALYLIKDEDKLAEILHRILGTMECYLSGFGDDGACQEGLAYWNYGFGFFAYFAQLLYQRTAGKINLFENDKVKQIALFPQKCYLVNNSIVSFADGDRESYHQPGLFSFLKTKFEEVQLPQSKYECGPYDDNCFRWSHFIRQFLWSVNSCDEIPTEDNFYLTDAQWMISRKNLGNTRVGFAAKGGNNNEPHNHNDLGSFILNVNGDMLLCDLGWGEYTKDNFGAERYSILCNGSQGHSVPILEGKYQVEGENHYAEVLESSVDEGYFKVDLTKAYENDNLVQFIRNFSLQDNENVELVISDIFTFNNNPNSVIERFVSVFMPTIKEDGTIIIEGPNGKLSISYDAYAMTCKIDEKAYSNHYGEMETVYIIDFTFNSLSTEMKFAIKVVGK